MSPSSPLPALALCGEAAFADSLDGLHLESIAARSRLHDWDIRPHRHAAAQAPVAQREPEGAWAAPRAISPSAFSDDDVRHFVA